MVILQLCYQKIHVEYTSGGRTSHRKDVTAWQKIVNPLKKSLRQAEVTGDMKP